MKNKMNEKNEKIKWKKISQSKRNRKTESSKIIILNRILKKKRKNSKENEIKKNIEKENMKDYKISNERKKQITYFFSEQKEKKE